MENNYSYPKVPNPQSKSPRLGRLPTIVAGLALATSSACQRIDLHQD
ncbi:hypothetical protein KBD59_01950 [Candidatus Gracilibacteria bacterium]|nr:hypothetical protein [Candidatus Gracilibacteria bacterium]